MHWVLIIGTILAVPLLIVCGFFASNIKLIKVFTVVAFLGLILIFIDSWNTSNDLFQVKKTTYENNTLYDSSGQIVGRFFGNVPLSSDSSYNHNIKFALICDLIGQINPEDILTIYSQGNAIHMQFIGSTSVSAQMPMMAMIHPSGFCANGVQNITFVRVK